MANIIIIIEICINTNVRQFFSNHRILALLYNFISVPLKWDTNDSLQPQNSYR